MSDFGDDDGNRSVGSDAGLDAVDQPDEEAEEFEAPEAPEPLYDMRPAKQRRTLALMTRFELARVIGVRAQQISLGAPLCLTDEELRKVDDPVAIATLEVTKKALPMIIRRYLPHGEYEDWSIQDLALPKNNLPPGLEL